MLKKDAESGVLALLSELCFVRLRTTMLDTALCFGNTQHLRRATSIFVPRLKTPTADTSDSVRIWG